MEPAIGITYVQDKKKEKYNETGSEESQCAFLLRIAFMNLSHLLIIGFLNPVNSDVRETHYGFHDF